MFGNAEREMLSKNSKLRTQNLELRTFELILLPAEEIEREMTPDSLKICLITGDERRADAARGQSDQDIESKLANFGGVIMIASPHTVQNIGSRHPMGLRRSDHLAALGQVRHKSTFNSRPGASQEFMQYH